MKYLLTLIALLSVLQAAAQVPATDSLPPYRKYPGLPAFYILKPDSSAAINTYDIPEGNYTVLIFFSPDCSHCQELTRSITASLDQDSFRNVAFYMATPLRLDLLRRFIKDQHLDRYDNIFAGKDASFFIPTFFKTQYVPQLVVYDEHKKFVKLFEGNFSWNEVKPFLKEMREE